jgi:hypothetical protein
MNVTFASRISLVITTLIMSSFGATRALASQDAGSASGKSAPSTLEIEEVYRRIDAAIVKRDRTALQPLLDPSFTFIHANGAVDAGPIFLHRVAAGTAMNRQRTNDVADFDPTWTLYGDRTAIRRSRVRFRFKQRNVEIWMIQSRVFVKTDQWRMALYHGTRVHSGSIVDADLYRNIEGTYTTESGGRLVLSWHGGGILVKWPDTGTTTQIFPVAESEFEDGYRKLNFAVGPDGRVESVVASEDQQSVLRAVRQKRGR